MGIFRSDGQVTALMAELNQTEDDEVRFIASTASSGTSYISLHVPGPEKVKLADRGDLPEQEIGWVIIPPLGGGGTVSVEGGDAVDAAPDLLAEVGHRAAEALARDRDAARRAPGRWVKGERRAA